MRKIRNMTLMVMLIFVGCTPHFHLDFLGLDKMSEVVLVKSKSRAKVLLVDVYGVLESDQGSTVLKRDGNLLSAVHYRLEKAAEDPDVKGVIIRLETPGGEVTASDIVYNEILRFKRKSGVPVICLMMNVTASGGYYIASACDYLMAHPTTLTGSIGVIGVMPNIKDLLKKVGVKMVVIKSGKMKDSGSAFRDITEEEKAYFQSLVDEYYQNFINVVYQNRKKVMSLELLKKIADGRVYSARKALELKLIDEIGYFEQAFKKICIMAEVSDANIVAYTYYPKKKTNIYAQENGKDNPFSLGMDRFKDILSPLGPGFYYLWLPQTTE